MVLSFSLFNNQFCFNSLRAFERDAGPNSRRLACYRGIGMKKPEIAKRMARQSGLSEAQGADRLGLVIHQILANLRKGNPTSLPGLGRFVKGADGKVSFEPDGGPPSG